MRALGEALAVLLAFAAIGFVAKHTVLRPWFRARHLRAMQRENEILDRIIDNDIPRRGRRR